MMSIINVKLHKCTVRHCIKHQRAHSVLYLIYCTGGPFEVFVLKFSNSQQPSKFIYSIFAYISAHVTSHVGIKICSLKKGTNEQCKL